jgi:D-alanyl-D-alanine dipeptidase
MARIVFAILLLGAPSVRAQISALPANDFDWVNLRATAPTIRIELRYASSNNIAHRPLYPSGMPPMVRAGVARRLMQAQIILRRYNRGLKIWDAYRPGDAQAQLWQVMPKDDYVVNPRSGSGSFHTWGVSVDATLVDDWGRPLSMPTDFDNLTPAAMLHYIGSDPLVRTHLYLLQRAMAHAGFYGLRTEWWHFTVSDWKRYVPERLANLSNAVALPASE